MTPEPPPAPEPEPPPSLLVDARPRDRLDLLEERQLALARIAAVCGLEFDAVVVEAVSGLASAEVRGGLDALRARRFVRPLGQDHWSFVDLLAWRTVYEALDDRRRASLHRRVAQALAAHGAGTAAEVARHWRAAVPAEGPEPAIRWSIAAGTEAAPVVPERAAVQYRRALELMTADHPRYATTLARLGEVLCRSGDPAHRRAALELGRLGRGRGDPALLVRAARASRRAPTWFPPLGTVDLEVVQLLERALTVMRGSRSGDRAATLVQLALELHWQLDAPRRVALADEGLALARRAGPDRVASVLGDYILAVWEPDTLEARHAALAELDGLVADGDGERSATLERLRTLCRAEVGDSAAVRALTTGSVPADPAAVGAREFLASWDQGSLPGLLHPAGAVVEGAGPGWRSALALVHLERGDRRAAAAELAAALAVDPPRDAAWFAPVTLCAEVAAAVGDRERAAHLYELLAPYRGRVAAVVPAGVVLGAVDRPMGLLASALGRTDEAEAHFRDALRVDRRSGQATFAVRTQRDHARALLSWGRDREARTLAGAALAEAEALGMAADAARLHRVLERPAPPRFTR